MLPPTRFVNSNTISETDGDAGIRSTDTDATLARLSAVHKGYLTDPFATLLAPRGAQRTVTSSGSRPPLINIGTHVRSWAVDELVFGFIGKAREKGVKAQIVSVGAGSDTRFWRLQSGPLKDTVGTYVELDFPENTTSKAMAIRKNGVLSNALGDPSLVKIEQGGTALLSSQYALLPVDLRTDPSTLTPLLTPLLNPDLPLLVLAECVLVYMSPSASSALLSYFISSLPRLAPTSFVIYEMFGLADPFGVIMKRNLLSRGVSLPGADVCPTLASLPARLHEAGYTEAGARTLADIRARCVPVHELQRIARLEMLDEIEELQLVLSHYALSWGLYHPASISDEDWTHWSSWGLSDRPSTQIPTSHAYDN